MPMSPEDFLPTAQNPLFSDNVLKRDDVNSPWYKSTGQSHAYDHFSGFMVLPIAGTGDVPPELVCVSAPVGMRKVNFGGTKAGSPPVVPAPPLDSLAASLNPDSDEDANDFYLSGNVNCNLPAIDSNYGSLIHTTSGSYTFVQRSTPVPGSAKYMTGRYPFVIGHEFTLPQSTGQLPTVSDPFFTASYWSLFWDDDLIVDSKGANAGDYT